MLEILNGLLGGKKNTLSVSEVHSLVATDGGALDHYGFSAAISADASLLVVGAHRGQVNSVACGVSYVYKRAAHGEYVQLQKLFPAANRNAGDYFGISAAISSNNEVIVIGAYGDSEQASAAGAAYVFTKEASGQYTQQQKFTPTTVQAARYFGYSVVISSDASVIAVGAQGDSVSATNAGAFYVFTKQPSGNYTQYQQVLPLDGLKDARFGISLSMTSTADLIIAGAYLHNGLGSGAGSGYLFKKQSNGYYSQIQKLIGSDTTAFDYIGLSVAIMDNGSIAVVGAYGDDNENGNNAGAAYVFKQQPNQSYTQIQKIIAPGGVPAAYFGYSLSFSADGNLLVVGAPYDSAGGSAYAFKKQINDTYTYTQKLKSPEPGISKLFGISVSVPSDGGGVLIGDYGTNGNKGSAYLFGI